MKCMNEPDDPTPLGSWFDSANKLCNNILADWDGIIELDVVQ